MKKLLTLLTLAISLASCSPYVLKSSGALNGRDLAQYKTFQLQEISKENLPKQIMEPDVERLYYVIAKNLESRGYKQIEGKADLTLYVGLSTKDSIETDVDPAPMTGFVATGVRPIAPRWGGYHYVGPTPYVHAYYGDPTITTEVVTDGILIVDMVDNSDNTHVFCSQISAKMSGDQLILKDNEKLADAISTLFKKFPIPVAK